MRTGPARLLTPARWTAPSRSGPGKGLIIGPLLLGRGLVKRRSVCPICNLRILSPGRNNDAIRWIHFYRTHLPVVRLRGHDHDSQDKEERNRPAGARNDAYHFLVPCSEPALQGEDGIVAQIDRPTHVVLLSFHDMDLLLLEIDVVHRKVQDLADPHCPSAEEEGSIRGPWHCL